MTTSPVAAYFNGVADVYDQVIPFFASFAQQVAGALDLAAGRPGPRPRGRARRADQGARRAGRPDGRGDDAAPRMVELLARDLPAVESHLMDAAALEFADATFDLVVAGFVLHILPDPVAAVAEVRRVLRPGGQFAFTVPGRADGSPDPWPDPLGELFLEYRRHQVAGTGYRPSDADSEELLARAGFADVQRQTLEIAIPIPDGETYWRFTRSHGEGAAIDGMPEDMRAEFHDRVVAAIDPAVGTTLRRSATLTLARR